MLKRIRMKRELWKIVRLRKGVQSGDPIAKYLYNAWLERGYLGQCKMTKFFVKMTKLQKTY